MNILNKFTLDNIKKNKKRTIVTIIGVALSTALICAVAGMIMSFKQTLVNMVKTEEGDYHMSYQNIQADQLKYIENNTEIKSYFYTQNIGYAKLSGSQNENKPYLNVIAFDKAALTKNGIKLESGRLPENENELVISAHIQSNARVDYNVGDTITLDVGTRQDASQNSLDQGTAYDSPNGENIVNTTAKTYKIVGIISRPTDLLEPYTAPGYTVITFLDTFKIAQSKAKMLSNSNSTITSNNVGNSYNISVTYKTATKFDEVDTQIKETIKTNTGKKVETIKNKDLLEYEGALSEVVLRTLYSLGAIIIGIIVVSSIFVIRNSFSISVSEKTKQYGMLSSIGATAKQVRKSVLFEGFIIGLIGIPLGIICGIIAILILVKVLNILLVDMLNGLVFVYSIPLSVILLTVLMSAVTIYLSCIIPARRASKISPIDAIRGNNDVKIKAKKVKTSKLTKKVFGIGGVIASKNLKRSRKKYRTTVISLVVSISIFIVLSSFLQYGKKMTGVYYSDLSYNIQVWGAEKINYKEIVNADEITDYLYVSNPITSAHISLEKYGTEFAKESLDSNKTETTPTNKSSKKEYPDDYLYLNISCINKEAFEKFAKDLGIKSDDYSKVLILEDDMIEYKKDGSKSIEHFINANEGESLTITYNNENDETMQKEITITKKSDKRPMGFEQNYINGGFIFVSEEYFEKETKNINTDGTLYLESSKPTDTENSLIDLKKTNEKYSKISIQNIDKYAKQSERMILVVSIFLYGFIIVITLIGVTNIFNTITTNMILRSKEFAMLKSIGMTSKEFNKMIRLESIMYGMKSLLIGIPIGLLGSYGIYKSFAYDFDFGYAIPWISILISVIFVFIIVGLTMKYSLNKINKQNIVETIRNDNI